MNTTTPNILESLKMQAGYADIVDFFSAYSLAQARKYLEKILKAANANRASKLNPSNTLFFFEKLQQLYEAAMLIHQTKAPREAIILVPENEAPDLAKYHQYCGANIRYAPWYFVPRSLSKKEYYNPYKVFKKLEAYGSQQTWIYIFHELRDYTYMKCSFMECGENYNILEIYILLNKLLEACHLIDIRAITEVDGRPRRKWKDNSMANITSNKESKGKEENLFL